MNKPHKHAELIKAWADGAEIEFRGQNGDWFQIGCPNWSSTMEYRIKPEPKYVPFETFEECIPLLGRVVHSKDREEIRIIVDIKTITTNGIKRVLFGTGNNVTFIYASELFKNFQFEDGTPCGKLEK